MSFCFWITKPSSDGSILVKRRSDVKHKHTIANLLQMSCKTPMSWSFKSSVMSWCVDWYIVTDVSDGCSALKMLVIIIYQSILHNIWEDLNFQQCVYKNLKSHKAMSFFNEFKGKISHSNVYLY
jgi:hypothetical protein